MAKEFKISITEITFMSGKKSTITFDLDDHKVAVPVDADVKAYFNSQFVRSNPTAEQRRRFSTLMNLLRAAYLKGREDGAAKAGT
ncbi:MAG: hypothetical protein AB7U61_04610 [Methylocystis sp.]